MGNGNRNEGAYRGVGMAALAGILLGGCVSISNANWHGEDAEPFDGARNACEAEAAPVPKAERTAKFEACMAARGWQRR